jgi:murein DD-endopeptidase MepM/ murein hydrolase activator NlpD
LGNVPADVVAELLQQPGDILPPTDAFFRLQSAYTIAPVRPRSTWISYTVQSGDTLEKIAKRFGIAIDTLAWNNDITYVNLLSPGGTLTILPEDGVLHRANGNETLQQIAEKYKVSPYRIIDSDYNPRLQSVNARPETLLPADYMVMVPGGTSEKKLLYWSPKITVGAGTSGGSANVQAGSTVSFGVGQGGSCGSVPNTGGSGSLLLPLPLGSYEVTRGFTSYHSGIDLAGRSGTTVFAADSGYIVYAGWVTYGYGNVVVIAHGSMMTIYGHLSSISVGCGQFVSQGQVVGATGSTGNSSGPHLHFEVRVASGGEFVPVNPAGYRGF